MPRHVSAPMKFPTDKVANDPAIHVWTRKASSSSPPFALYNHFFTADLAWIPSSGF